MLTGAMSEPPARVAHIGIAVTSIDAALGFYRDVLGLEPGRPETVDGATIVAVPLGDVQIELLERCRAAGFRLIDDVPRIGAGGRRIAFLHPKTTAGILLELTE